MGIRICETAEIADFEKIYPSIIYNRFDLFSDKNEFYAVKIQNNDTQRVVEYKINGKIAELGIWLMQITVEELEKLVQYIQKKHECVEKIIYRNGVLAYGKAVTHNNYRIIFPKTADEMKERVSSQSWHKMRRRNRRASEVYGEMKLVEYKMPNIPLEIVEAFFQYKKASRNRIYDMTAQEYLDRYHVTDCYVVMFGDTIGGMHFCCEQCPMIYGENHSYNPDLKEYSLGKFIFTHSLIRMVEKGYEEIFLGGGDFEYKTHYSSIEETLYDCEIIVNREKGDSQKEIPMKKNLRNKVKRVLSYVKIKIKKVIPLKVKKLYWKSKK